MLHRRALPEAKIGSSKSPTYSSGPPYHEFAAAYGLVGGPDGDDDHDRICNAFELLMGSDPTAGSSLPSRSFTRTGQQSVFSFVMPLAGVLSRYAVESSPDLESGPHEPPKWAPLPGPAEWPSPIFNLVTSP